MRMAPILATVFVMSAASAPAVLADDVIIGNNVSVPVGESSGAVIEGPLKGAIVAVPRAVGAIGTSTGQIGLISKAPAGLERYVGAKVLIGDNGKGIVSDPPHRSADQPLQQPAPTKKDEAAKQP